MDHYDPKYAYLIFPDIKATKCTRLMFMILKNSYSIKDFEYYLKNNKSEINEQNSNGWTALMIVCANSRNIKNSNEIIKLLILYGANLDIINSDGWTALTLSILHCKTESSNNTVKLLLKHGANVNWVSATGWSVLMIAARGSDNGCSIKIVKLLLKYGAKVNLQNSGGITALMFSACNSLHESSEKIVNLLLEYKADVNLQCNNGSTALMLALAYFQTSTINTIKLLLDHGADPNLRNNVRLTALIITMEIKNNAYLMNIVDLLLKYGADPNLQYNNGLTALILAMQCIRDDSCSMNIMELLLNHKAKPNIQDNHKNTALTLVNCHQPGYQNIIKILLKYKADPNLQNKDGRTIFMKLVTDRGNDDGLLNMLNLLVENGANFNLKDSNKENALEQYIKYTNNIKHEILQLLLLNTRQYRLFNVHMLNPDTFKLMLDSGLTISYVHVPQLATLGFDKYIKFYYYIQHNISLILKELSIQTNQFQYKPTSIRSRINLLKMHLQTKNYNSLAEITNYKDIINYLAVVNIDHLKNKINYYVE